jgi:chromosome segregation ATPase
MDQPSRGKITVHKGVLALLLAVVFLQIAYFWQKERRSLGFISSVSNRFSFVNSQNRQLKAELEQLRGLIQEREESMLKISRDKEAFRSEVTDLKLQLAQFKRLLEQAEQEKKDFQVKNQDLNREISGLKEDLRLWSGEILEPSEAKPAFERRKLALRQLRKRISDLKRKTRQQVRTITMVLGNQGYLLKDGRSTYADEDTIKLEKIVVIKRRVRR